MAENNKKKNNTNEEKWKRVLFALVPLIVIITVFICGIIIMNKQKDGTAAV